MRLERRTLPRTHILMGRSKCQKTRGLETNTQAPAVVFTLVRVAACIPALEVVPIRGQVEVCIQDQEVAFIQAPEVDYMRVQEVDYMRVPGAGCIQAPEVVFTQDLAVDYTRDQAEACTQDLVQILIAATFRRGQYLLSSLLKMV